MKKFFAAIAIIGISIWSVSELNAALSQQISAHEEDTCHRSPKEFTEYVVKQVELVKLVVSCSKNALTYGMILIAMNRLRNNN